MAMLGGKGRFAAITSVVGIATAGTVLAVPAAVAAPDGGDLVINEVYLDGGSAGATYANKFVELANPTDAAIDVDGWSVQYRSATGTAAFSGVIALGDLTVQPHGTLLVAAGSNGANGAALPTADATGTVQFSGSAGGTIALVSSTTPLSGAPATVLADPQLVDLVGYGTSNTFEKTATPSGWSVTNGLSRTATVDTDDNAADFSAAAPTPTACGQACAGGSTPEPTEPVAIADIQGDGTASPLVGQNVTTRGVVTAVYASGGFNAAYIQTAGTGGTRDLAAHPRSDGLYVYGSAFAQAVAIGDSVDVTGAVAEYNGLTQIVPTAWTPGPAGAVTPTPVQFPLTAAQRESLEGMLLDVTADRFTVTNNYATNTFGEVGLASGDTVLPQPTNEARPGSDEYRALVESNANRLIALDDGQSVNYTGAGKDTPVPWLTATNEVRTGAAATVTRPLVLDYRYDLWRLQPTTPFGAGNESATIASGTRESAPQDVGGAVKLASFNVLNYFTTTGEDWVAAGHTCTFYRDRSGAAVTVNSCDDNGPRGAANDVSLARQQAKIVHAINGLDADVTSLEEIEDTGTLGGADRDEALDTLVAALNADAGTDRWAAVPSPSTVPESGRDVIRTAFIYQKAAVTPVGESAILDDPAFANARAPLAQEFRPVGGTADQEFLAVVNHFKSKGSGEGENADTGDGQGASNPARVAQATALVGFVDGLETSKDTDLVFLLGDFNSYAEEDPLQVIEDAGFVSVDQERTTEETYQFDGLHGSLDHVFASPAALDRVTGADVWTINAPESIAREYSRYDNNVTPLFDASTPFRASDHDPVLVGFDPPEPPPALVATPVTVKAGRPFTIAVSGLSATGVLTAREGRTLVGAGLYIRGKGAVLVPGVLRPGTHQLVVELRTSLTGPVISAPVTVTVTR